MSGAGLACPHDMRDATTLARPASGSSLTDTYPPLRSR
jgi:hypothetical protein